MIDPHDQDDHEAQQERHIRRPERKQSVPEAMIDVRHADLEDQQRDRNCKDAVAERLDAGGILSHADTNVTFSGKLAETLKGTVMRSAAVVLVALALAACGNSSTGPGAGFECLGNPLPTTAPSTIHVTGVTKYNALNPTALQSASVRAFKISDTTTALDTTTSDGSGQYTLTIATGATPVDGYVRVTKTNYLSTYGFPAVPLSADATDNILVLTSSEFGTLASLVGESPTPGDGFIAIVVTDCAGNPLTGATVASNPAGRIHYNAGGGPSSPATSTSTDGVAYIFNVVAGDVTIIGTASVPALRQHVVNTLANAVTLTQVHT